MKTSKRSGFAYTRYGCTTLRASRKPRLTSSSVALEAAILVLDAQHIVVADGVERADEAIPAHLAQPRQARDLPADADTTSRRSGTGHRD